MSGKAMRVLRTVALAISVVMPFSAGAVWNGVVNPPLGQPDGTTQTFIDLPDQPTQQAVDSDACNDVGQATNDPCPPGFDWYVQSDYKWKADLGIKLEYRNSNDVVVGEGRAQTGLDGNVTQWTGYTIQTEFGTIRVGGQYAGREGRTSRPSDSNSDLVNKGADRTQWSDGWRQGDQINVTPDMVNKTFQNLFPLNLKPRLSISGYIDSAYTFESDGNGLQPSTDLPANYWSGLEWSTSQNWDTGFEAGPKTDVGPIGTFDSFIENKWGVDYKINADPMATAGSIP